MKLVFDVFVSSVGGLILSTAAAIGIVGGAMGFCGACLVLMLMTGGT